MIIAKRLMNSVIRSGGAPPERIYSAAIVIALAVLASPAVADVANWSTSDLDIWLYGNAPSGTRATMPSFTGGLYIDEATGQFFPKGNRDTARQGAALVAFNTTAAIQSGMPAESYQIQSVTLTLGLEAVGAEPLYYRNTPITNAELLADVASGQVETAMPFELYGVAFREAYTGFGFGPLAVGPPLLEEASSPYNANGYLAYPIAHDGAAYIDVMNNLTGGFSATAPGNVTEPFNATPWAIGQGTLGPGDEINDDDEFTFSLDLTLSGVKQYVQAALAKGELGFFLSSFHITGEFGVGGAYPSWYSKEAPLGGDAPPRLMIKYTIAEPLAGDFDFDGDVDGRDLLQWQRTLGASVAPGSAADGSGNGIVDGDDLNVWRESAGAAVASAAAVPEPAAGPLLLLAMALAPSSRHRRRVSI